jgi:hypothetical protein
MRVLVVETTSAKQAATAARLEAIDSSDRDLLDLSISLANPDTVLERFESADVVLLGASLGERSFQLTRQLKQKKSDVLVLVFVASTGYSGDAFRTALTQGARKVLCE